MRVIFYAEPKDPNAKCKTKADDESLESRWITITDLETIGKIRGPEALEWFTYLKNGGIIYPLSLFTFEGEKAPKKDQIEEDRKQINKQNK